MSSQRVGAAPDRVALVPDRVALVPRGFAVRPCADTKAYGNVVIGGSPRRTLRLNPPAMRAWDELIRGGAGSDGARALARRLLDAGIVHPQITPVVTPPGTVTVVVPVRDRPAELDACLEALRLHSGEAAAIIVVDDASDDRELTDQIAGRYGAEVVALPDNVGPAAARNAGLRRVRTPIAACVDSDCVVGPGWLDGLVPHFADPHVAAVAPRIVGHRATALGLVGRFAREVTPLDLGPDPGNVIPQGRVSYVPSATLLLRVGTAHFDESMRYGEDVDLLWRLHQAGHSVRYEPAVRVGHREPTAASKWLRRRYDYGTSAALLDLRHPGKVAPAIFRPLPLATAALFSVGRPRSAAAVGVLSFLLYRRQLARLGLPTVDAARDIGDGIVHSIVGASTWLQRFAPFVTPLVIARALRRPRGSGRYLGLVTLALPAYIDLRERRRRAIADAPVVSAPTFVVMQVIDRAAYGTGVLAGAIKYRRPMVVLPRLLLPARVRAFLRRAMPR